MQWQGDHALPQRQDIGPMVSSLGVEPIRRPAWATATRFACNHDWTRRGDNTKYKAKK